MSDFDYPLPPVNLCAGCHVVGVRREGAVCLQCETGQLRADLARVTAERDHAKAGWEEAVQLLNGTEPTVLHKLAAALAEADALRAERDALLADRRRIDWLAECPGRRWQYLRDGIDYEDLGAREAFDWGMEITGSAPTREGGK